MNIDKYEFTWEEEFNGFKFISERSKGIIHKLIEFQKIVEPDVYNLAFGDKHSLTGQINDLVISDNGDTEKVLTTVAATVYQFLHYHPAAYVYAQGSTKARTRLYRMGITRLYNDIVQDFFLYGRIGDEFSEFEKGKEYVGFLVQRKFA